MRSVRLLAALAVLVLVSSCSSVGKLPTPSTRPEVTLTTSSKQKVFDALVAWSAMKGRQATSTTEYSLTTTGEIDGRASNNIFWDVAMVARTIYTPVAKGSSVTIYSQRFITFTEHSSSSNYGAAATSGTSVSVSSAHEKEEEYNNQRAFEEMQIELEDFAKFFAESK